MSVRIMIEVDQLPISVVVERSEQREDPAVVVERLLLRQEVYKALDEIGEPYASVLKARYNLGHEAEFAPTIEELAVKFHTRPKHIRQMEQRAILKLRRIFNKKGVGA